MNQNTALIIGATGLVGEACLHQLADNAGYETVIALTRSKISFTHPKVRNIIVDFNNLDKHSADIQANHVYCAMGTTIGKAGSKEAFRKVDYEIPMQVARIAKANGAEKFMLVSSLGADAKSSIFYSRVKGELEESLKDLGYKVLLIFRPSILLGNRKEKRTGEEFGRFFAEKLPFLFAGPLAKYRGTPAQVVAKAMVNSALVEKAGTCIIENEEIFVRAEKLPNE